MTAKKIDLPEGEWIKIMDEDFIIKKKVKRNTFYVLDTPDGETDIPEKDVHDFLLNIINLMDEEEMERFSNRAQKF